MSRRRFLPLLFIIFLIFKNTAAFAAADSVPYFTYSMSKTSASGEELVKLQICANKTEITAAGFRVRVSYDQDVLTFIGTETSAVIKSGTMGTNDGNDPIYSVYVCNTDKKYAPKLYGNIIYYVFQIKKGAAAGKTAVSAQIDQICDYDGKQLNADCEKDLTVNIVPSLSDKARLTALKPLHGRLNPNFSQNVFEYTMDVDYDISSVYFQADAADGGKVKINRKNLYKAGSDTPIIVTVTSADKQQKTKYIITVTRRAKPASSMQSKTSSAKSRLSSLLPSSKPPAAISAPEKTRASSKTGGDTAQSTPLHTQSQQSGAASQVPTEAAPESTPPTAAAPAAGNIYFIEDRMPTYMTGMLACAVCILTGVILNLWFTQKKK